jgi:hypothetical protein
MLKQYSEAQSRKRKEKLLWKARSEVNINANGTTGYTLKSGPDAGKALKHISIKHPNN